MSASLKIIILTHSIERNPWVLKLGHELESMSSHRVQYLVSNNTPLPSEPLLMRAYRLLDASFYNIIFGQKHDPNARLELKNNFNIHSFDSVHTKNGVVLNEKGMQWLKNNPQDVCLNIDFPFLSPSVTTLFKLGVATSLTSLNEKCFPYPGLEDMIRHQSTSTVWWVFHAPGKTEPNFIDAYVSHLYTYSLTKNLNHQTSRWIRGICKRIENWPALTHQAAEHQGSPLPVIQEKSFPASIHWIYLLPAFLLRWPLRIIRELFFPEQWYLSYKFNIQNGDEGNTDAFVDVYPDINTFIADPFPIEKDGKVFVFYEVYKYRAKKSYFAVSKITEEKGLEPAQKILELDCNISYPFLFSWNDTNYLIPETFDNKTIDLYKCSHFPDQWVFEKRLLDGIKACDTTLVEHNGKWWLFTCQTTEGYDCWDELHLYFAESPLGEWTPHPLNPVVTDVHRSRPAGKIYKNNGTLFRPAQDCSEGYGSGLVIHKIEDLSTTTYKESILKTLQGNSARGELGIHTWNQTGPLTMIDKKRRIWTLFHGWPKYRESFGDTPIE